VTRRVPGARLVRRPAGAALVRPASLRGRLTLLALLTTAGWIVLLTAGFNLFLGARLRAEADGLLRTRVAAVSATVQTDRAGTLTVREPRDDTALDTGTWIYQGGRAIERPRAPAAVQAYADRLAGSARRFGRVSEPVALRFHTFAILDHGRRVGTIVAAVSIDPYRRVARLALIGSIGLTLLILAGIHVVTGTVIGRALEPVARMSAQAAEWGEHEIGRRFGAEKRPAELAALAANLDELLDRLATVLRHERQLSGELSHELRTPLARIGAEAELLLARPRGAAELRAAHTAIAAGVGRMSEILETLLSTARAGVAETPGRCDVTELAARLARSIGPPLRPVPSPRCVAGVPGEIVERILAPILDNARRYARAEITIAAETAGRGVRIAITDDGPGVAAGTEEALFEPGRRGDPADGHDGAGLGLALARRLARTAGGDVVLARTGTGATFEVRLPPG
jgi:signal transduction histidine kinase